MFSDKIHFWLATNTKSFDITAGMLINQLSMSGREPIVASTVDTTFFWWIIKMARHFVLWAPRLSWDARDPPRNKKIIVIYHRYINHRNYDVRLMRNWDMNEFVKMATLIGNRDARKFLDKTFDDAIAICCSIGNSHIYIHFPADDPFVIFRNALKPESWTCPERKGKIAITLWIIINHWNS